MKTPRFTKRIAFSTLAILGAIVISSEHGSASSASVHLERSIPLTNIKSMMIKTVGTDIKLIPGSGDQIQATLDGQFPVEKPELALVSETKGNILTIHTEEKDKSNSLKWDGNTSGRSLTLLVPKTTFEKLKSMSVDTVSGETKILITAIPQLALKSVSGNIQFKGDVTETLSLVSVSGKIDVEGKIAQIAGESVSGSFEMKLASLSQNAKLHSISGAITLNLPEKSQVEIQASSMSGQKDIESLFKSKATDRGFISAKTVSGNIKIKKF